ncbi:MAG: hypothetical protein WDM88_06570 [Galbitalea sp.]
MNDPLPVATLAIEPAEPAEIEDILGLREILELGAARAAGRPRAERGRARPTLDPVFGTRPRLPRPTTGGSTPACT